MSASDNGGTEVSRRHPAGTQADLRLASVPGERGREPKSRYTTHQPFVLLMMRKATKVRKSVEVIRLWVRK